MSIVAQALSVRLGDRFVLENADIRFEKGLIGVVGPNGAGKSSFIRALLGLVRSAGSVSIDRRLRAGWDARALARRIAYLPQGQALHWPLSVERLVALGRLPNLAPFSRPTAADRAAIERAMAAAGVTEVRDRIATELSGGERARVLLARALAVEADALIADEPLAALDPAHQLEVMTLLRRQAEAGTLVIAVLHDLTLAARFCDRLVLIDRGRIVADGAPTQVLTPERLRQVYGVEAWIGTAGDTPVIVPLHRV